MTAITHILFFSWNIPLHLVIPAYMWKVKVKVAQSCLTLCDPMDYTVHEILQPRILEWVAFPFSRGSTQSGDWTQVSHIAGRFFTSWATREGQEYWNWVTYPFSSGFSWPRNQNVVSCIAGGFFTSWAIRELFIYFLKILFIFNWRIIAL